MVGRRGSTFRVPVFGHVIFMLCVILCAMQAWAIDATKKYDINLPSESVATALNGLSEQTNVPAVFSYDLAKSRISNSVIGRYTLLDALDVLLKGTGLSGGLSDQ